MFPFGRYLSYSLARHMYTCRKPRPTCVSLFESSNLNVDDAIEVLRFDRILTAVTVFLDRCLSPTNLTWPFTMHSYCTNLRTIGATVRPVSCNKHFIKPIAKLDNSKELASNKLKVVPFGRYSSYSLARHMYLCRTPRPTVVCVFESPSSNVHDVIQVLRVDPILTAVATPLDRRPRQSIHI